MPKSGTTESRLPAGYPSAEPPTARTKCCPKGKSRGDRSFIEGCLFALCCCWLCDVCF